MLEPAAKRVPILRSRLDRATFGVLRDNCVTVYCHAAVLEHVLAYSERDVRHERGGFLLGGFYIDESPYVEVEHFLPAADTRSRATSLTFTHETWARVNRVVSKCYPQSRIIGWQHTHPDLGVFLSEYDRFIHRHFFSAEWQIALVVDPVSREIGFYHWHDNQVVDCGFVCIPQTDDDPSKEQQ